MALKPIEVPYSGRKKGGTKRGKTAMAVPARMRQKRGSLNSVLSRAGDQHLTV